MRYLVRGFTIPRTLVVISILWLLAASLALAQDADPDALPPIQDPHPMADVPAETPHDVVPSAEPIRPGAGKAKDPGRIIQVTLCVQGMGDVFRGDATETGSVRILSPAGRLVREHSTVRRKFRSSDAHGFPLQTPNS